MDITQHFRARMQQRGFSLQSVDLVLALGEVNGSGDRVLLGRKQIDENIKALKHQLKEQQRLRATGGAVVACSGSTLITAFHRTRKAKRD